MLIFSHDAPVKVETATRTHSQPEPAAMSTPGSLIRVIIGVTVSLFGDNEMSKQLNLMIESANFTMHQLRALHTVLK